MLIARNVMELWPKLIHVSVINSEVACGILSLLALYC